MQILSSKLTSLLYPQVETLLNNIGTAAAALALGSGPYIGDTYRAGVATYNGCTIGIGINIDTRDNNNVLVNISVEDTLFGRVIYHDYLRNSIKAPTFNNVPPAQMTVGYLAQVITALTQCLAYIGANSVISPTTVNQTYVAPDDTTVDYVLNSLGGITSFTVAGETALLYVTPAPTQLEPVTWQSTSHWKLGITPLVGLPVFTVNAATAANLSLPYNYSGGVITGTENATVSVDGVGIVLDDTYLLKDLADQAEDGIYTATAIGDGSHPFVFTRIAGFNVDDNMISGVTVNVLDGTTNGGTSWTSLMARTVSAPVYGDLYDVVIQAGISVVSWTPDHRTLVAKQTGVEPTLALMSSNATFTSGKVIASFQVTDPSGTLNTLTNLFYCGFVDSTTGIDTTSIYTAGIVTNANYLGISGASNTPNSYFQLSSTRASVTSFTLTVCLDIDGAVLTVVGQDGTVYAAVQADVGGFDFSSHALAAYAGFSIAGPTPNANITVAGVPTVLRPAGWGDAVDAFQAIPDGPPVTFLAGLIPMATVEAKHRGSANITVGPLLDGVSEYLTTCMYLDPVITYMINPQNVTLNIGNSWQVPVAPGIPEATGDWSSSDPSVATVNLTGLVRALAEGSTTVSVRGAAVNITVPSVPVTQDITGALLLSFPNGV